MRNEDWLQKILYLLMAALAVYIIVKGGGILLEGKSVQNAVNDGSLQRPLEDAAMRTYAPGYTATVEGKEEENWIANLMKPVVPVYSYLAEGQGRTESEAGEGLADEAASPESGRSVLQEEARNMEVDASDVTLPEETDLTEKAASEEAAPPEEAVTEETKSPEGAVSEEASPPEEAVSEEANPPEEAVSEEANPPEETLPEQETQTREVVSQAISQALRQQLSDFNYLLANYYTVDGGTTADAGLLDAQTLLDTDLSLVQNPDVPQILIYHTHSQEAFADSREGEVADTIVGMGEVLAEQLRSYGYNVIHDTGVYDLVNGILDRSAAYDYARESVEQILAENPTIEVIVDLHRDGVDGRKFVTEIGGKPASMIMFFNGISRNSQDQALSWLPNEYLQENLAFSLQMQLLAREQYPGFTRNIYLKAERFNLHLRPRSLLIEAGTQLNTVEEEKNAMEPLAHLLHQVLSGVSGSSH